MTIYRTTCPHCGASFKITDEQLQLKAGRVRCGNCQTIFQANEHLSSAPAPNITSKNTNVKQPAQMPSTAAMPQSNSQAKVQIEPSELAATTQSMTNAPMDDEFDDLFNDTTLKRKEEPTKSSQMDDLDHLDDGLIHDEIDLDEDSSGDDNLIGDILQGDFTQAFNDTHGNFPAVSAHSHTETDQPAQDEERWLNKLLDDDEHSDDFVHATDEQGKEPEDLTGFLQDIGANTAQFSAVSASPLKRTVDMTAVQTKQVKVRAPIQSKPKFSALSLFSSLFWLFLSLIALVILAGQYLYFNFDNMAKDPSKVSILHDVCGVVGCKIPLADPNHIDIREINRFTKEDSGRSHISFVVANTGSEPMLIPSLKITLSKKDEIIGGNLIKPDDYLVGQYDRITSTPIDAEIVINKSIDSFDDFDIEPIY